MAVCCLSASRSKFSFKLLVVIVILLAAANGNTISIDVPSVTTSPGQDVQLTCTFDGTWGVRFNMQWLKDGNPIADPTSTEVKQDYVGRFSLALVGTAYTLSITGIEIGDAGNYECAFSINGAVQQTLSSVVTVIASPTDVFLYHGNMSNKISGGQNYMFEDRVESVVGCAALGGQPVPVLEVSIGDSVQSDFNSVTLDPTTDAAIQNDKFALGVQDTNKKIKCTWKTPDATNPRDQGSVEVTLTIGLEPSENPVLTTQQLNDQGSTKFMCSGQLGHPAKGITWYRTLSGQQQNRTSEAQSSNPVLNSDGCTYSGQSELRVDVSASDDGAQFTCMIGQKSASVLLTAASNPEITYTPTGALPIIDSAMGSVEFVKGSVVTLICSATGYPQPNFKWFYREELSNITEVLNGLRDNPSVLYLDHIQKPGYYECQASNVLNQLNDPPSKVLRITLSAPAAGTTVGGLSGEATGGIIGAILGVIVIIVLACFIYTYYVKKKRKETREEEKVSQGNNAEDEVEDNELQTFLSEELRSKEGTYERPVNSNLSAEQQVFKPMEEPQYAEIQERDVEIRRQNIKLMEKIGSGAFSQVFRGSIFNLDGKQNWSIAAVKTAKDSSDTSLCSEMMKELKVMLELQPHPNVVQLLGSCTGDDAVPLIIVEYLPNGNLQDYLRNDRSKQKVLYGNLHGISSSLTPSDLIKFALDVANGMSYLSSMAILHRDLAARNILVAEDRTCKISDFGFAKDVIETHTYEKQSQGRLPIRWMSPEALFDNIYSTQSDIWAYGVLLWEIVTLGSSPYPGMSAKQVMEAITEGYRMPQPPHCSLDMYIIMSSCWEEVPSSRSTFKDIVNSLDVLLASNSDYLTLGKFEEKLYEDIDKYYAEEKC